MFYSFNKLSLVNRKTEKTTRYYILYIICVIIFVIHLLSKLMAMLCIYESEQFIMLNNCSF